MLNSKQKRFPRPIVRTSVPIDRFPFPQRPVNRLQCLNSERPCLNLTCRYNLFIDITKQKVKLYNEPSEELESCCLDIADKKQGMNLEEIAVYFNVTRERIRQIINNALRKIMRTKYAKINIY